MLVVDPTWLELDHALSVHALSFTSQNELLFAESEGDFSLDIWDQVCKTAQTVCCGSAGAEGIDTVLGEGQGNRPDLKQFFLSTMEAKVGADLYWQ